VVVVVVVLAIFAILGVTGGNDNGSSNKQGATTDKQVKKPARSRRKQPATKPKPTSVRLRIVPSAATYLCVDRGPGTPIVYQGTTVDPQTFRGKRLRVNIGNASTVRVSSNGKRVRIPSTATIVGYEFTPTRSRPLPAGQTRPCA
jgi:hypothetical protein